jgi:HEAT repeat protein
MTDQSQAPLSPEDSARLVELARACKAALRAVTLYPSGHPAIGSTLGRIAQLTSAAALPLPLRLSVLPDGLRQDDRAPARPDPAIAELATLLHAHLVGELVIHPDGGVEGWRQLLVLLGRAPEEVRQEGGIARAWATLAGRHVEIREIDYAEALKDRSDGETAAAEAVIGACLQGQSFELDDAAAEALLAIASSPERLAALMASLESRAGAGLSTRVAALARLLRGIVETATAKDPARLEPVLRSMAEAAGQLAPQVLLGLLAGRSPDEGPGIMGAVASRMTDRTVARFVARNVIADETPMDRLAQAFQALVHDGEQRARVLEMAKEDVAAAPFGRAEDFDGRWGQVAQSLLTSYSDKPFVSEEYGRELARARRQALEVEQTSDDPPERITAWLQTVATSALRSLDLALLLDLLRIETDEARWGALMPVVISVVDDLLLVGDFDAALQVVDVIAHEATDAASMNGRRPHAARAVDQLVNGSMMRHISTHLASIDDVQFERVKRLCGLMGEALVRPLAEALSVEDRARPRERLTAILLSFGNVARRTVERLKSSTNPAVRRTAIQLMRSFGGSDALPDLTELLNDTEPQVQRDAVRAILGIGSDEAYRVLEQALSSGTAHTRDAIMQSLTVLRDERATPLLTYILRHVSHRGELGTVYVRAIESLGALRDPDAVEPLREALYKGEWWAPRRSRAIRQAAAAALARIGTPGAIAALDEAASAGPSGVRAIARASLETARRRGDGRAEERA